MNFSTPLLSNALIPLPHLIKSHLQSQSNLKSHFHDLLHSYCEDASKGYFRVDESLKRRSGDVDGMAERAQNKRRRVGEDDSATGKEDSEASTNNSGKASTASSAAQGMARLLATPRKSSQASISIAILGSTLSKFNKLILKSALASQIARAAALYQVREIIVYEEQHDPNFDHTTATYCISQKQQNPKRKVTENQSVLMANLLQYIVTPPALRKHAYGQIEDFQCVNAMQELALDSHQEGYQGDHREGVVTGWNTIEVGLESGPVTLVKGSSLGKRKIGDRVMVRLVSSGNRKGRNAQHTVECECLSRQEEQQVRQQQYFGYTVRLASSLSACWREGANKYDSIVRIDTTQSTPASTKQQQLHRELTASKRPLLLFGRNAFQDCMSTDPILNRNRKELTQQARLEYTPFSAGSTLHTEEAVMMTLSQLAPLMLGNSK